MDLPDRTNKPLTGLERGGLDVIQTKDGEMFDAKQINQAVCSAINNQCYFETRARKMTKDIDAATGIIDKGLSFFNDKINQFFKLETETTNRVKRVSGDLRDQIQKMGDSLSKLEKVSNLDQLQKRVELMERAATAMKQLSELEATGKLDKILAAMK